MYPQQQPNKLFYKLSQRSDKLNWFVVGVFALVFFMFGASATSDESYEEKLAAKDNQITELNQDLSYLKSEVKELEQANASWSDRLITLYGKLVNNSYKDTLTMTKQERAKLPDTFVHQSDWTAGQHEFKQVKEHTEKAFFKTFETAFKLMTDKQDINYWYDFSNDAAQCIAYGESILMVQDKLVLAEGSDFNYVGVLGTDTYSQYILMQQYIGTVKAVFNKLGKSDKEAAKELINKMATARNNYLEQVEHGNIKQVAERCQHKFGIDYEL